MAHRFNSNYNDYQKKFFAIEISYGLEVFSDKVTQISADISRLFDNGNHYYNALLDSTYANSELKSEMVTSKLYNFITYLEEGMSK